MNAYDPLRDALGELAANHESIARVRNRIAINPPWIVDGCDHLTDPAIPEHDKREAAAVLSRAAAFARARGMRVTLDDLHRHLDETGEKVVHAREIETGEPSNTYTEHGRDAE